MPADQFKSVLAPVNHSQVLPDPAGLLEIVGSLGYSLEDALADIVDNSIDAEANKVLIRICRSKGQLDSVVIADNGLGMTESVLESAMAFGVRSQVHGEGPRLGKYGLGLKSASFSQCKTLSVLSRPKGRPAAGRQWTADGISGGWSCGHLSPDDATELLDHDLLRGSKVNTLVRWDQLSEFGIPAARTDEVLSGIYDDILLHLGLHLHRFIEDGVEIEIETYDTDQGVASPARPVLALDPFGYHTTGKQGYPREFAVRLESGVKIAIDAHIWPKGVRPANFLLGRGQLAHRQGFYVYRNRRLIQAGGWNGVRTDSEPHFTQARARIELTPDLDEIFGLNVRKAGVNVPPDFATAVTEVRSEGQSFASYISDAESVYRAPPSGSSKQSTFVPGSGFSKGLRKLVTKGLASGATEDVRLTWKRLPDDEFFEIDRENYGVILNTRFRSAVEGGKHGKGKSGDLTAILVFLLLRDDVATQRLSKKRESQLKELQRLLIASAEIGGA